MKFEELEEKRILRKFGEKMTTYSVRQIREYERVVILMREEFVFGNTKRNVVSIHESDLGEYRIIH